MAEAQTRIILGIDPGTTIMGFGLLAVKGSSMSCLQMDELKLNIKDHHYLRLQKIFNYTIGLIDEFHPDEIAIEAPFWKKCSVDA